MTSFDEAQSEQSGGQEKGVSVIEFAIVLPVLFLFLFGIIQYGYLFAAYLSLRSACAVGARAAVLEGEPDIEAIVRGAVQPFLLDSGVQEVNIDENFEIAGPGGPTATRVEVLYNIELMVPFLVPNANNDGTLTMTAVTIMR